MTCPHCGGRVIYLDEDRVPSCWTCSWKETTTLEKLGLPPPGLREPRGARHYPTRVAGIGEMAGKKPIDSRIDARAKGAKG